MSAFRRGRGRIDVIVKPVATCKQDLPFYIFLKSEYSDTPHRRWKFGPCSAFHLHNLHLNLNDFCGLYGIVYPGDFNTCAAFFEPWSRPALQPTAMPLFAAHFVFVINLRRRHPTLFPAPPRGDDLTPSQDCSFHPVTCRLIYS